MAEDRKSAKKTARRVLADSSNAKHRFGFAGAPGTPITTAPKLSDLWFIEYKTVSGKTGVTLDVSGLAKSISHISLMAASQPIDQYGKRIYVPTRVDFPEVTIQMHDTVDGKMFKMAEDIYSKFFKNNDAKFTAANAEEVLTSSNMYGRKIPDSKHSYYHQSFEKITVYHFFGNLERGGPAAPAHAGTGKIQKIELINPLVTSLTFSPSDYSISELRTVDMSVQPENIIISNSSAANFPAWMTLGMDYMMSELTSINKPIPDIYPDHFGDTGYGPNTVDGRFKKKSQDDRDMDSEGRDVKDEVRKINELMRLYNKTSKNPDSENIDELTKELKDNIGIIDIARKNRYMKSTPPSVDDNQRFASPYSATYENPDIPGFGDLGDSNPAVDALPSYSYSDFGSSMINELVSSFFGNRSFNINNTNNSLFGSLSNLISTSSRVISGSKISDGIKTSRTSSTPKSAVIIERLPDIVENVYKRGSEAQYSPGVSPAIRDKFK